MKTVMIVDDDTKILKTLSTLFKKKQYHVETSFNGQDCLEKIKGEEIVLLDIMMPGMSGQTVAKKLRERYGDKVRIIFLTIKNKADVSLMDIDGFIQKPFDIEEVVEEVRKWET